MMSAMFARPRRVAGHIAAGLAAITLGGAAGASDSVQQAERCVQIGSISGYTVIDDRHFVLQSGASNHFLVTTATRCSGLRYGVQLATSIQDNQRLCPPLNEYVIPEDGWRCRIASIEAVESHDAARALVEERRQASE